MNRFDTYALVFASCITLFFGGGAVWATHFYMYVGDLSWAELPVWLLGGAVATYGPIAAAALFWRWAKQARRAWVAHILFLPCALLLFRAGDALMLSQIRPPDFDDTIGGPIVPAMVLFVLAVGGYFVALIAKGVATVYDSIQRR